ncbi:ABC transporter permease subunit [Halosimplex pelagicum]|uniref:ABC transporter permease subunit n=1 Tax=Halosimplex pelagicum TaxID=869886 RepID=A0A7D5PGC5_9EURY|nr:ABC transporter permease subunit [Halosimplex pelagicum]QLH83719.1 ABC transporter permease subunit [Halosimplex pelagicum]
MSGPPPVGGDDRSGGESGATGGDRDSRGRRFARWLRTRVENVARIARWEVTKNAGGVDRRTAVIALLAVLGLGAMAPVAVSQGVALDQGIYRVGVVEEDPLYDPAYLDPTFRVQDPSESAVEAGYQEIMIVGPQVREYTNSTKGRAAVAELRSTVKRYNDGIMDLEDNQSAAFPVVVNLTYVDRESTRVTVSETQTIPIQTDDGESGGGDGSAGDGDGGGGETDGEDGTGSDGDAEGSSGGESSDGASGGGDGSGDVTRPDEGSNVAGSSIGARLTGGSSTGAPSDITPPFPFRSLVLAFVFVLPLNFVIQAYGSTILSERINRRGELLLVAPVSRGDIIVGKTLPYFAAAVGVATGITLVLQVGLGLGGSMISVLAVVPLAMLFLAATFLGAMFARSFKELTFVTVTITVSLTSYAFVPAIFTDVTPIALISPLTLVVRDLQGQAIGLGQFVFSTLPPTLTALVCFGLGAGLYREEDMFTQRPIPYKVLDALAGPIERRRSVALVTAVLLPFVLVAELVVAAFVYPLWQAEIPVGIIVVVMLIGLAVVEELAKSLHVYAGYAHSLFDDRLRTALVVGAFSGLGFFLAEKLTLIVRLADLQTLPVGQTVVGEQAAVGIGVPLPILLVALLLAPLALHVVTASISALGARRGRRSYAVALVVAVAVHVAYNLTVVSSLVG